jgi:hypothetical protein
MKREISNDFPLFIYNEKDNMWHQWIVVNMDVYLRIRPKW